MKHVVESRWFLLVTGLLLGIIMFRNISNWMLQHSYQSLVDNTALVQAFVSADPAKIAWAHTTQHIGYQQYRANRLVASSGTALPVMHIIGQATIGSDVIATSASQNLAAMQPYVTRSGLHRYLYFVVAGPATTSFVVYKEVPL